VAQAEAIAGAPEGARTGPPTPAGDIVLYHGSSSGLLKGQSHLRSPYLTDDPAIARHYAEQVAEEDGSEPVVFRLSVHPSELRYDGHAMDEPVMVSDDERDQAWGAAAEEHPEWLHGGYIACPPEAWEVSLQGARSVRHEGDVAIPGAGTADGAAVPAEVLAQSLDPHARECLRAWACAAGLDGTAVFSRESLSVKDLDGHGAQCSAVVWAFGERASVRRLRRLVAQGISGFEPLVLCRSTDGQWGLIDGYHRLALLRDKKDPTSPGEEEPRATTARVCQLAGRADQYPGLAAQFARCW
jgi:hypothetical protein